MNGILNWKNCGLPYVFVAKKLNQTAFLLGVIIPALLAVCFATPTLAATGVTITPASGGGAISANTNGATGTGAYTALTGPVISENNPQGVATTGTLILNAPAGFEFDPATAVTAQVTPVSTKSCDSTNGVLLGTSSGTLAQTVSPTATTITINVFSIGIPPQQCVITFTNIKVRPTTGTPLTSGNITRSGAVSLTENPATTNYGTLSTVVGAAAKLVFVQQPGNTVAGASISPAVTVAITDRAGNIVTTNTSTVTLAIGSNPGAGALSGTVSVAAVAGVATFGNLSINKIGSGYTLVASDGALSGATSSAFNIIPGAVSATVSTVTASPTSVQADGTSTSTITVTLKDGLGNPVSGKTVTLSAGAGSSIISAASGTSSAGGVVTFTVKDAVAEAVTYTAKDTSDNITLTQTATVTYTPVSMVLAINRANPDPTSAATVAWTVTFSRSVTGVNASVFTLVPSGVSGAYITSVTGSGTTWTVTANTGIGSGTLGLNQTGPGAVVPPLIGTFTGQLYTITATPALAEYRMDEASWNGTPNEVVDSSGSGNNARAFNSANTATTSAALVGSPGTCGYGVFDNGATITSGYIQTPLPNLTSDFTVTAWIRTTNNTLSGQRILIDDQGTAPATGYGFSLADGATGILRFYSRGISPVILDSTYTVANNTWYFVAAVADIINRKRTIYVYNQSGSLLNTSTEGAWTGGTWGTDGGPVSIGGETNASAETPASFHFRGNLDEVRVYQKVLSQNALAAIAMQSHPCAGAGPDHYELSLPTASINCVASTVTVTACADAGSPCTNKYTAANGTVATLSATGGTLSATSVTFDATGVANTTLSYPLATDGAAALVTLAAVPAAAANPNQCCPNGVSCVNANSCSTTFKTTGFIVSSTAGGAVATIPPQVSGITSGTYYLRAVKTSTTTQACESALSGANTVTVAYECNNPASCSATDLMSVNGGSATTIARNNNGSVTSFTPVSMTFDANGNAPFTLNYSDVGNVTLHAKKAAGGALLTALSGSSNAFVVAPDHFEFSAISPGLIKAGTDYAATITARNAANTTTPNFGKETAAEGVTLASNLVSPVTGVNPAIGNNVIAGSSFVNGVAAVNNLSWGEVGLITMTANLTNAGYLGTTLTANGTSGNTGRFIPDHFDTVVKYDTVSKVFMSCPASLTCPASGDLVYGNGIVYSGQAFTTQVTAMNGLATPAKTLNYNAASGYSKAVTLGAYNAAGSTTANPGGGTLTLNTINASAFSAGVGTTTTPVYTLGTALTTPADIYMRADESTGGDGVSSLRSTPSASVEGAVKVVSGRIVISNAYGSELLPLTLSATAQYYSTTGWLTSLTDNITSLTVLTSYPVGSGSSAVTLTPSSSKLSGGVMSIKLAKPSAGKGVATVDPVAPGYLPVTKGTATFGIFKGNNDFIYQRESY